MVKVLKYTYKDGYDLATKRGGKLLYDGDLSAGVSCVKSLLWQCNFGHEFRRDLAHLIGDGSWCPQWCLDSGISLPDGYENLQIDLSKAYSWSDKYRLEEVKASAKNMNIECLSDCYLGGRLQN